MPSIYKITNIINNKCYIGKTIQNPIKRFKTHIRNAVKYNQPTKLYNAIRKYGSDNFIIEVIETCLESELNDKETMFIEEYDTYKNGYNMTKGGDGADTSKSPNYISFMKKIKEEGLWKGSNSHMTGITRVFSDEHKLNISIAASKRIHSLESNIKRSDTLKGRESWNKGKLGYKKRGHKVKTSIGIFDSISEACRIHKISAHKLKKYDVNFEILME